MSVRRMSGWEPAEVTTFEYDGDQLVRSVTVREPEWAPDDVALLLASRRLEADMGSHGVPMSKATDPAIQGKVVVNEVPRVDFVRLAIDKQRESHYTQYPDAKADQGAHIWYVKSVDD